MIESRCRSLCQAYQKICVEPFVSQAARITPLSPTHITLFSLLLGLAIPVALFLGNIFLALFLLLLSGYCDTVDGSLARKLECASPQGAALDIMSDRIVEWSIIFGLFLINTEERAILSLLMLGSVFICVTSFLVVGIFTEKNSEKSFHYSIGIVERAEAFLFFALMMLFPSLFTPLAFLFSLLVFLTATIRIYQFVQTATRHTQSA